MKESIENLIKNFVKVSKKNFNFITKWENPIVAFAKANDPLFLQLRNIISKEHKLPHELLSNAKTVISYFLPFNLNIVLSNNEGKSPSSEWAIAYIETNKLINEINVFLSSYLGEKGFNNLSIPPTHNFNKELLVSYWSNKHVAFIAGLGKFGLHKMIITEKGCCGRLGTLITSAKIKSTNRIEKEYCLYFHNKTCKLCIDKCVFDVLKIDSFNRHKCYKICFENSKMYSSLGFSDICGKCACGVPCSTKNPVD